MKSIGLAGMTGMALLLAACGGGSDEPAPAEESAASVADETEAAAETPAPEASETPAATETTPAPTPSASATTAAAPAKLAEPTSFAMCKACHSVKPGEHGIGPSLAGVFGHKAGSVAGYEFSPAMKDSGLTLDAATLDKYLENPRAVVPGTKMAFAGMKDAAKRKEVIDYLKSL